MLLILSGIALSYYMLQLNFELTSHNFGSRFTYFFNNNLFLLEAFFIVLVKLLFQLSRNLRLRVVYLLGQSAANLEVRQAQAFTPYIVWGLVVLGLVILIASFLPLLNYFF